jgi:radical SAM protein with 4Fe4S-binding SPASM domain
VNLPPDDADGARRELHAAEIRRIAEEAASLGALWVALTGGEPLLRPDFRDLYLHLKKRGFLVSVFTNATIVTRDLTRLFEEYPPRDIEVTVYGASERVYECVTRRQGSYREFRRGLDLLFGAGLHVTLKATMMQSNKEEFGDIARFCEERSSRPFRFDPFLNLRADRDARRNREILEERLTPGDIVAMEGADRGRSQRVEEMCRLASEAGEGGDTGSRIFLCRAGMDSCTVGYDGELRLCVTLNDPSCVSNARRQSLAGFWHEVVPRVRAMQSCSEDFLQKCGRCRMRLLCLSCPAGGHLETGALDGVVDYACEVARARDRVFGPGRTRQEAIRSETPH